MKKRILSTFCALALCLGLLAVTALAAAPTTLIVGNVIVVGTGDGSTLSPQGTATRAQLAVMLYRWLA